MSGGNCALIGGAVGCSSCGRSRGRGPRSGPYALGWLVFTPDGTLMWVRQSRAEAARDVRAGNRAVPRDQITRTYRWRYEARRIPLDGSDPLGEAMRLASCVGCQDGRSPVEPKDTDP